MLLVVMEGCLATAGSSGCTSCVRKPHWDKQRWRNPGALLGLAAATHTKGQAPAAAKPLGCTMPSANVAREEVSAGSLRAAPGKPTETVSRLSLQLAKNSLSPHLSREPQRTGRRLFQLAWSCSWEATESGGGSLVLYPTVVPIRLVLLWASGRKLLGNPSLHAGFS